MIPQYFDTIQYRADGSAPAPYQDGKHDWITPAQPGFTNSTPGRAEANSKAESVPTQDGQMIVYTWMLYFPRNCPEFKYGQDLQIVGQDGNLIGTGTVKRFKRGTMNARVWV